VQTRRILVVDDHPVVRRGMRAMLEGEAWVEEVVEASTVAEAVREAITRRVDVVAMDITLPDGDGIEATRRILTGHPEANVLILTLSDDEDLVERALRVGARGYLLKDTEPDTVVDALRTVAGGGIVLGPRIGSALVTVLRRAPAHLPPPFDQLTNRERDILARLAQGDNNAQIARRLGVAEKTIRNQLSAVFTKLGVTDRLQAALMAREAGILN